MLWRDNELVYLTSSAFMDAKHSALPKRLPWGKCGDNTGDVPISGPVSLMVSTHGYFLDNSGDQINRWDTQCPNQQKNWCGGGLKRKTKLKIMNVYVRSVM